MLEPPPCDIGPSSRPGSGSDDCLEILTSWEELLRAKQLEVAKVGWVPTVEHTPRDVYLGGHVAQDAPGNLTKDSPRCGSSRDAAHS